MVRGRACTCKGGTERVEGVWKALCVGTREGVYVQGRGLGGAAEERALRRGAKERLREYCAVGRHPCPEYRAQVSLAIALLRKQGGSTVR